MNEILEGFVQAIYLIITLDPDVLQITTLTLEISTISTLIAILISIPIANLIFFKEFKGKGFIINIVQTLYSLPTVLVGLLCFLLLSHSGPLGFLDLLFTPEGMVIGQSILILPIIIGLTISSLNGVSVEKGDLIWSLGASSIQKVLAIMHEAKFAILSAMALGFGRAISEVGVAMMIGGNINGYTRVITTTMSLETQIGNVSFSIALGIILLSLALIVNTVINRFQVSE